MYTLPFLHIYWRLWRDSQSTYPLLLFCLPQVICSPRLAHVKPPGSWTLIIFGQLSEILRRMTVCSVLWQWTSAGYFYYYWLFPKVLKILQINPVLFPHLRNSECSASKTCVTNSESDVTWVPQSGSWALSKWQRWSAVNWRENS